MEVHVVKRSIMMGANHRSMVLGLQDGAQKVILEENNSHSFRLPDVHYLSQNGKFKKDANNRKKSKKRVSLIVELIRNNDKKLLF